MLIFLDCWLEFSLVLGKGSGENYGNVETPKGKKGECSKNV